jgi:hypothetical protein
MTPEKPPFLPDWVYRDLQAKAEGAGQTFEQYYQEQTNQNEETISIARTVNEKHPQTDMFICDLVDFAFKDATHQMDVPLYALTGRKDANEFQWLDNGNELSVIPSALGRATIHDKDLLIYVVSKLMNAKNNNEPIGKKVFFTAHDFLVSTNRDTSGRGYINMKKAMQRLVGTSIHLKYKLGDKNIFFMGHLVESAFIVEDEHGIPEQTGQVCMVLSDLLFSAVEQNHVLTISRDYFLLRSPLHRRLAELARKYCGHQKSFKIGLEKLHNKVGSRSPLKTFKFYLKKAVESQPLPQYLIDFDESEKNVIFINNKTKKIRTSKTEQHPELHTG